MPSFTFVSTANAFVLRGAIAGLRRHPSPTPSTSTRRLIEAAITPRTKAIVAGPLRRRRLRHGRDHGRSPAGTTSWSSRTPPRVFWPTTAAGRSAASATWRPSRFHETKNIISGEGGALLVNDARFVERAEVIWEKGTNRSQFFRGQVDKYTWVDLGSSYLPGEIIAAFLWAQMEEPSSITSRRMAIWDTYHEAFAELERTGHVRRPIVPPDRSHNAHMYYLLLPDLARRTAFIDRLKANERPVGVPLHPAALVAVRAIGRPFARRHVGDGRRQRSAGAAAAVARSRGRAAAG